MRALLAIGRVFRPLDTSHVSAAMERLEASTHALSVRARALRMDVSCGDPDEKAAVLGALLGQTR